MTVLTYDGVAYRARQTPELAVWPCPYCHRPLASVLDDCGNQGCVSLSLDEDREFDLRSPG